MPLDPNPRGVKDLPSDQRQVFHPDRCIRAVQNRTDPREFGGPLAWSADSPYEPPIRVKDPQFLRHRINDPHTVQIVNQECGNGPEDIGTNPDGATNPNTLHDGPTRPRIHVPQALIGVLDDNRSTAKRIDQWLMAICRLITPAAREQDYSGAYATNLGDPVHGIPCRARR